MRLEDKVAIITGAGQGIGEAYARRFAKEGARVVVADINAEKGAAVARDIGHVFERVDVSSEDDTQRLCRAVADRFGRIDVLINNAAIFFGIDNQNTSYAYLRRIFDVNYFGAWLMCRAVFLHMLINFQMAIHRALDPDDLTGTAVWLASDDAKMVTGQVIPVDGGMIMLG